MVGGDAATFARVRDLLDAFGEKLVHCGPVGAGHASCRYSSVLILTVTRQAC